MTSEVLLIDTDVDESLRAAVQQALKSHCPPGDVRQAYDGDRTLTPRLWKLLATELGLAGLIVPVERGGAGASAREVSVVMHELGRFAAPTPFLESSVIATTVALAGASGLVADLADGRRTAALLVRFTAMASDPVPDVHLVDGRLSGRARSVVGALDADVLLVPVVGTDGLAVYAVDADEAVIEPVTSLDMTRPLADISLVDAPGVLVVDAPAGREAVDRALRLGAAMLAAESAGIAAWSLEATVAYLKERRQFGRAVGSYQALKHRLADLYVDVESSTAAARHAAGLWAANSDDAPIGTAVAASFCSDVAVRAAEEATQLHGGIGMTWEHPAHLYLKRAKANQLGLGVPERHRAVLGDMVDLTYRRSTLAS